MVYQGLQSGTKGKERGEKMKKNRSFNLLLTGILTITMILTTTVFVSAASIKINKSKLTLDVGKTASVKILNTTKKVTWTTNKKSVAAVKSTGSRTARITAKKAGTAVITGKIGKKKYTCRVTVKNPIGSRLNPADPTKGVTIKTSAGTMSFELENVYKGVDAVTKFKELDGKAWDQHEEYSVPAYPDFEIIGLQFQVNAKSGFETYPLRGSEIISEFELYDGNCKASISNFHQLYFLNANGNLDTAGLSLFGGGSSQMYAFFLVPKETTSFSNFIYTSVNKPYWIKYNI